MSLIKSFKNNLWYANPVAYQILGICSSLAVTVNLQNSLVMGISLTVVVMFSNFLISLMRNYIPHRIRIIVQLVAISVLVIVVDQILQAYYYAISKQLSVFVGLIITNCIVMGRAEAYAMSHKPLESMFDGLTNGLGYTWVLIIVGSIREIFGSGSILGLVIIPQSFYDTGYVNNSLMVYPPAAFILLGMLIWLSKIFGGAKGEST